MISLVACALAALGPGRISLDHVFGLGMVGWVGLLIAIGAGGGGALLLLVTSWKPAPAKQAAGS
jgi:putative oxidoreductase